MAKESEWGAFTPFFQLHVVFPSQVPSTLEEFAIVVATEELDSIRGLFMTDRRDLFCKFLSHLFMSGSLISIISTNQDDVLGSSKLSREWYELKARYEVLEQQNYDAENGLVVLLENIYVLIYLWEMRIGMINLSF